MHGSAFADSKPQNATIAKLKQLSQVGSKLKLKENKMPQIDLNGIFPPIPTPFVDGNVAYDKLASNIGKWSQTGLKGVVVMGPNGEHVF